VLDKLHQEGRLDSAYITDENFGEVLSVSDKKSYEEVVEDKSRTKLLVMKYIPRLCFVYLCYEGYDIEAELVEFEAYLNHLPYEYLTYLLAIQPELKTQGDRVNEVIRRTFASRSLDRELYLIELLGQHLGYEFRLDFILPFYDVIIERVI